VIHRSKPSNFQETSTILLIAESNLILFTVGCIWKYQFCQHQINRNSLYEKATSISEKGFYKNHRQYRFFENLLSID